MTDPLDLDEFRRNGHALIDWIADYLGGLETRPVVEQVEPGTIRSKLPAQAPATAEPFADLLRDLDDIVVPGLTHWQHPGWFAYFPGQSSPPSILGEPELRFQASNDPDFESIREEPAWPMVIHLKSDPYEKNAAALSRSDIISGYSTLFALKMPDLMPGLDQEFSSIQGLFARYVMGLKNFVDHNDIFLKPNRGVLSRNQVRRPMESLGRTPEAVRREGANETSR